MQKRFMKNLLSVLSALTACLFVFICCPDAARAEEYLTTEDGDWEYEILEHPSVGQYVKLQKYRGKDEILTIPSQISGIEVKSLGLIFASNGTTTKEVTVPGTVQEAEQGVFRAAFALEKISVENGAEDSFHSVDGVLYFENDMVSYPAAREGETYVVSEDTEHIDCYAFYGCSKLKRIVFSNKTKIYPNAFSRSEQALDIVCKSDGISPGGIEDLNASCWEMAAGTRILVRTEELKEQILSGMTRTKVYKDSTDTMAVEVLEELIPAQDLTFADGSREKHLTVSYTDYIDMGGADSYANHFRFSPYIQYPADTTEEVEWSLKSGEYCCEILPFSGAYLFHTLSGGEAVLAGTDESGHEITLYVTVHCPMACFELNKDSMEVRVGSSSYVQGTLNRSYSYAYGTGVEWEIEDTDIAEVETSAAFKTDEENGRSDINGEVRCYVAGRDVGTTTLTATVSDDGTPVQRSVQLRVVDGIGNCTVDPIPGQEYTGSPICPVPVVRYKGRVLTESVDYVIDKYYMNINGNGGNGVAEIRICGMGYFDGVRYEDFSIVNLPGQSAQQNPSQPSGIAPPSGNPACDTAQDAGTGTTGTEGAASGGQEPEITGVKDSYTKAFGCKSFTLKAQGPSPVSYASSNPKVVKIGKTSGRVTVKGIGKAEIAIKSGSLTKKVTITVNPAKVTSVKASVSGKKAVKVSWKRNKTASGYQVQYAIDQKFSKGKKTDTIKSGKKTSCQLRKPSGGKKTYIRVRAYKTVKGKKFCSEWSKVKKISL